MFDYFCMDSQECISEIYETCTKTPTDILEISAFFYRNSDPALKSRELLTKKITKTDQKNQQKKKMSDNVSQISSQRGHLPSM